MTITAGDIRSRIKSDLTINGIAYDSQILDAIHSALRQLRGKRFWFLQDITTIILYENASSATLPTDYSAPFEFELSYGSTWRKDGAGFNYYTFDRMKRDYWNTDPLRTGVPEACAVVNQTLYVSCIADADYNIRTTYYKQDATLPEADQTSIWFDDGLDVVRSLAQYIFKRDSQGFTANEADSDMVQMYLDRLNVTHENRQGGR